MANRRFWVLMVLLGVLLVGLLYGLWVGMRRAVGSGEERTGIQMRLEEERTGRTGLSG